MKTTQTVLFLFTTALALVQPAKTHAGPPNPPTLVVLPGGQQTVVGNAAMAYPWNLTSSTGATSLRYQQVYAASNFGGVSGPICQLGFRVAPAASDGTAFNPITLSNVTIVLSTTAAAPDGLSATFADNTGTNAATVFNGPLTLCSSDVIPPGANAAALFDTRVYLQTPFNYNPANGNLLLDIKIDTDLKGGLATSYFDAQNTVGDAVSRAWATNSSATAATTVDTKGIITQFMFGNTSPGRKGGISWFLSQSDYNAVHGNNASVAAANFNNSQTYIFSATGSTSSSVPSGWSAIGGLRLSLSNLMADISNGTVGFASASPNIEALDYGSGNSSLEDSNAYIYYPLYANLAHAYGYTFIPFPSLDIMTNWDCYPIMQCYITRDCPTETFSQFLAASPADICGFQGQTQIESIDPSNYYASDYSELSSNCAAQAFGVNSNVVVWGGIGVQTSEETNPATIDQMYAAVIDCASQGVSGFWFNISVADAPESVQLLQLLDAPPVIVTQPAPATQNLQAGASATWSVLATGAGPVTYQWYQGSASNPVPGATNASYTLANATISGAYFCNASNFYGATNSSTVEVNVLGLSPPRFATNGAGPVMLTGNGTGQLHFSGTANTTYRVWGSTNLASTPITNPWTLLGSGTFSGGADSFAISVANQCQFYLITQP